MLTLGNHLEQMLAPLKRHAHDFSWACRRLLVLPLLLTAACMTDPAPENSPPTTAIRPIGQDVTPPDEEALQELAALYMLDDPPQDVEFERYISPEEYAAVMVPCVTEQGIPVEALPDGGLSFGDIPPEQSVLQAEAMYRCEVRFPTHPMFLEPLDSQQLERLYDYFVGDLTACLHGEEYETPAPPSREAFVASYYDPDAEPWSPWPVNDPRLEVVEEWHRLNQVCPQSPPLEVLYGDDVDSDGG